MGGGRGGWVERDREGGAERERGGVFEGLGANPSTRLKLRQLLQREGPVR